MSEYRPDKWKLIRIDTPEETLFKILAGWSGGYADSDSWRINSGITKVEETDTEYLFYGYSGSVYVCNKDSEGFTALSGSVWSGLLKDSLPKHVTISLTTVADVQKAIEESK